MSDLSRMYSELAAAVHPGALAAPEELRRHADRRARIRAAVVVAGVALVVAGTVTAAQALINPHAAGPIVGTTPGPGPSPTAGPTPAGTPSAGTATPDATATPGGSGSPSTPDTSTGAPTAPNPPVSIPDRAFFVQPANTQTNNGPRVEVKPGDHAVLWSLCGASYPSDDKIVDRRMMRHIYKEPSAPADTVPHGTVYQTITSYSGGGARAFVNEVVDAVRKCPRGKQGDLAAQFVLLDGPPPVGDGAIVLRMEIERKDVTGVSDGMQLQRVSVVRVGDVVTVLRDEGVEGTDTVPDIHNDFTGRGAASIEKWLG